MTPTTTAIKLTSPAAIRAACELSIAQGEQHVQVMYKSDDFDDDDYVGADLEEFASVKDDPEEFEAFCGGSRHSWELWTFEYTEAPADLRSPWSLNFDRDGTEDVAIILDANGEELVRSRHFWRPKSGEPVPPTLMALRAMTAAPKLLEALRCAHADLEGARQALEQGDYHAHDWKAHQLSIDEASEAIAAATDDSIGRVV